MSVCMHLLFFFKLTTTTIKQRKVFNHAIIFNTGTVNEWDTVSLGSVSSADAMGSPIWCMDVDYTLERLAVGTDNGKVL